MKDIHQLLEELKQEQSGNMRELEKYYRIKDHPARELDEYMKEQYMMLLFSVLKSTEGESREAIGFLYYLAEKTEFLCKPEKIVKYIYTMDEVKINDCSVSFESEEIRYLLGVEFFLTFSKIKEKPVQEYMLNLLDQIGIEKGELKILQGVSDVIESGKLSLYPCKEYREYCRIFRCYLYRFDFDKERKLVVSNCIKEVRDAGSTQSVYTTTFFGEGYFISDHIPKQFDYVEKGEKLGHFKGVVQGFGIGMYASTEKWKQFEEDESKYLKTEKFKHYDIAGYCIGRVDDENTYETVDLYAEREGIFFLFCNHIDKYNLPVGVISHPLEEVEKVEAYFLDIYWTIYDKRNEES